MEWINVNDQLPPVSFEVIICNNKGFVTAGYYMGDDGWEYNVSGYELPLKFENVTHWMCLPKSPKS